MDETGPIADAITACVVETMNTTEVVESASFYSVVFQNVLLTVYTIFTLLIIFRLVRLFVEYIKTGSIGEFSDDSFIYNLTEGHPTKVFSAFLSGIFPGAILIDSVALFVLGLALSLIWPALAFFLPVIGLAYLIRLPIARKQEFIGRLDGTYGEESND